ncbi:FAD-dependent monooxygenase [Nonomuraea aurantiaca]|uniref:FAD-dependent monooxygenase n=1 Tax=Nonomuraea aurantiaca TaxID=2878562 RepID=UPI001CDA440F|nr:FAD-dependent monooxygenase [Nonomuraea aurantiaca]MCA2225657.1 FAD-dependent monooxygenase [Nonomuraea aurantiaca]
MAEAFISTDVLIVGAGPTGLALACDLVRRGINCRILDRADGPSTASRAKTIQPRALEVADDLGVINRVMELGAVHVPTRHYDHDKVISEAVEAAVGTAEPGAPYAPVWLSQPIFEQILRDCLVELGGNITWGATATDVRQDGDAVEVSVRTATGDQQVRARYVVGCDGGRSLVRQQIGVALEGVSYGEHRWWLGDVHIEGLDRGCQHLWMSPEHGILSLFPLPSTDIWQFQASIPADDHDPVQPTLELFRHLFAEHAGLPGVAITDADWLSLYKINVCLADRYRMGRVFLAGDAAHIHSPAGGQGMNTGIQDAYNLGWKLAAVLGGADAALLDTYEVERRPVARAVLDDSTARLHAVMHAAESGDGSAAQHGLTGDFTTGLTIAYPHSPLTGPMPDCDQHRARPGDRAPDAEAVEPGSGRAIRIFDLLRGPHWTLLAFDRGRPAAQATIDNPLAVELRTVRVTTDTTVTQPGTIIDLGGRVHSAYDIGESSSVLIRPDGYIAHIAARTATNGSTAQPG